MTLREIDSLVAEKVMGWHMSNAGTIWLMSNEKYTGWDSKNLGDDGWYWNPTEDIAAAWQVVEKMRLKGYVFQITVTHTVVIVLVTIPSEEYRTENIHQGDWTGAPLAICLAALRAVGCEVEVTA